MHVNAAIGPGLAKHARSPLHAFVPMFPSDPAAAHAKSPVHEPALTFPWVFSQAEDPWQLFLAMAPWFPRSCSPQRCPR